MNEFIKDVLECKEISLNELNQRRSGIEGESTIEQIENVIVPELEEIIRMINESKLPPKEERYFLKMLL